MSRKTVIEVATAAIVCVAAGVIIGVAVKVGKAARAEEKRLSLKDYTRYLILTDRQQRGQG